MPIKDGFLKGEDWSDNEEGIDQYGNIIIGHDARGLPIIDNSRQDVAERVRAEEADDPFVSTEQRGYLPQRDHR
jgi:hypothetical protein